MLLQFELKHYRFPNIPNLSIPAVSVQFSLTILTAFPTLNSLEFY